MMEDQIVAAVPSFAHNYDQADSQWHGLIVSSATRRQLDEFSRRPSQALMLTGAVGVGLGTIARALARQIAGPNIVDLRPSLHNKQKTVIINADDVAGLGQILRDRRHQALAIIIDGADQAAPGVFERMLKLIEEPVAGVHYIFTAHDLTAIPNTIMSRTSLIKVVPPTSAACQSLLTGLDQQRASQIKFIADRRPAMMRRLIDNAEDFSASAGSFEMAKQFLQGRVAMRLKVVNEITDKTAGLTFCADLAHLIVVLVGHTPAVEHQIKLSERLDILARTADRLTGNGNTRLQMINLALNF